MTAPRSAEAAALIETLDRHRAFLLVTAEGLSEDQARHASTVSALTVASLLKHVADTERQWMDFAARGAEAFTQIYNGDIDWEAVTAAARAGEQKADARFVLTADDTLETLRRGLREAGDASRAFLATADLDAEHALPEAPWFELGARWSVRRVALHLIAEIAQHAGHADIIREAIDGQRTMG